MNLYSPIYTERLMLREYIIDDYKEAHSYLSDPEVLKYMEFSPTTEEQSRDYVNRFLNFQKQEPRIYIKFVVILKTDNCIIGECGLLMPNYKHKTAELVYRFNKDYWGKGYATEAAKAILNFGFYQLSLHRIDATCDIRNSASSKVIDNIGMQKEGCLREHKWVKEWWRSSFLYSILEYEFKQNK